MVDAGKRKRFAESYRALIPLVRCEETKRKLEAAARQWETFEQPHRERERVQAEHSGVGLLLTGGDQSFKPSRVSYRTLSPDR